MALMPEDQRSTEFESRTGAVDGGETGSTVRIEIGRDPFWLARHAGKLATANDNVPVARELVA